MTNYKNSIMDIPSHNIIALLDNDPTFQQYRRRRYRLSLCAFGVIESSHMVADGGVSSKATLILS